MKYQFLQETKSIKLTPHAKINLGLLIKGKREDGYHLLETLLYPITSLSDELLITESQQPGCQLTLSGIELDGNATDNLCVKAHKLLVEELGSLPGCRIALKKGIPAGAGLGGGSADAAATLLGLNKLFDLGLSTEKLAGIAARLGADVPFFIYDEPMLASGIGTELSPFELQHKFKVSVETSRIHSSTIAAYKALNYRECDPGQGFGQHLKRA